MQWPRAQPAAPNPGGGSELLIDTNKKTKKGGILQNGVAHFGGLLAW